MLVLLNFKLLLNEVKIFCRSQGSSGTFTVKRSVEANASGFLIVVYNISVYRCQPYLYNPNFDKILPNIVLHLNIAGR